MKTAILLSVLVIVPSFVASSDEQGTEPPIDRVAVDIYYEALCPDSQKFFNQQFQPNIGLIVDNYVNLVLTPYGKEKHVFDESTGAWKSECRHTERECEGHRIQACALGALGVPATSYRYISCLMKNGQKGKPYPGKECADHLKKDFPEIDYPAIETCAKSPDVERVIEELRIRTEALQPPITSVPVIVFNHVYNQEDQDLALKNFKQVLCKYLSANSQDLETCTSNSSAADHTMTVTLLLSALTALLVNHF